MCTINIGSINHNHCQEITVHSSDIDINSLIHSFFSGNKESVQTEDTTCAKNAQMTYCEYIHRENLREQGLYSLDEFEQMIATAAKQPAPQFAKFLKRYQKQGNLDFHGQDKKQIFDSLRKHFPEMREYDYPNFAAAF